MRGSRAVKVAATVGAAAVYRKMRAPVRQNSPFRRAWELNLLRSLRELEELAAGADSPSPDVNGDPTLRDAAPAGGASVASGEAKPRPFVYAALGDSAAQGLGAASVAEGYVPRIAAGLEAALGRRVILLNVSLSGGTAESVLTSQLPQLAGLRAGAAHVVPDLVTLDVGGNDVSLSRLSVEDFAGLMDRVCRELPGPAVVANIPTFKPLASAERAARLSAAIDAAAKKHGCGLVDLLDVSEAMSTREYIVTHHAADMFHPSSAWYSRWAELFMEQIARIFGFAPPDMAEVPAWSGAAGLRVE